MDKSWSKINIHKPPNSVGYNNPYNSCRDKNVIICRVFIIFTFSNHASNDHQYSDPNLYMLSEVDMLRI